MERPQIERKKCVHGNTAEWPSGLRSQAQENPQWREFWYTNVRVGSNPTPVFKPFEHDEAEPSADKFYHTGTSIQDDSAKQKKTKKWQRRLWLITEWFKSAQKRNPEETCETRRYAWVSTQSFTNGWQKPFSRLNLWNANSTQLENHTWYRKKST